MRLRTQPPSPQLHRHLIAFNFGVIEAHFLQRLTGAGAGLWIKAEIAPEHVTSP